jgi:hypothetical protein
MNMQPSVYLTGENCHYCGAVLISNGTPFGMSPFFFNTAYNSVLKICYGKSTTDHVQARSKGGTEDETNMLPACHRCNNHKRAKSYVEFLASKWLRQQREAVRTSARKELEAGRLLGCVHELPTPTMVEALGVLQSLSVEGNTITLQVDMDNYELGSMVAMLNENIGAVLRLTIATKDEDAA